MKPGPKPKVLDQDKLVGRSIVRKVQPWMDHLTKAARPRHGNARLDLTDAWVVMLAGFFNPMIRSLRLIEQLSQSPLGAADPMFRPIQPHT